MLYTNEGEVKMLGEASDVLSDLTVIAFTVYDAMVCAGAHKSAACAAIMESVSRAIKQYEEREA